MKKSLFFTLLLSIIFIFSSCVLLNDSNTNTGTNIDWTEDEYQNVKLIYTAYNEGWGNYGLEELKERALTNAGANEVMFLFSYFEGNISFDELINDYLTRAFGEERTATDYRIRNYIGNIIKNNSSYENNNADYNNWLINYFDSNAQTNNLDLISSSDPNVLFLKDKIYKLLDYYSQDGKYIDVWFDFYKEKTVEYDPIFSSTENLSETILREYSEYLARVALTYTNSDISINQNNSSYQPWDYTTKVIFNDIPVELYLAVVFRESKFIPFSYRAEKISDDSEIEPYKIGDIYGLSFGLSHILIDISKTNLDNLYSDDFTSQGQQTFTSINSLYFEDIYEDWDLLSIRGSTIYSLIYLDVLMNKLEALK